LEILVLNGIVNGLIVGGVYALIGMSLTLLYGVLRVVNFAHGEFVIGGSFLAYVLFHSAHIPPLAALPIAAASFFVLGYAAY
jgi:branched-chain amino acid transport system permease protein